MVIGPNQEAWLRDLETTTATQVTEDLVRMKGKEFCFCAEGRAAVVLGLKVEKQFYKGIPYADFIIDEDNPGVYQKIEDFWQSGRVIWSGT